MRRPAWRRAVGAPAAVVTAVALVGLSLQPASAAAPGGPSAGQPQLLGINASAPEFPIQTRVSTYNGPPRDDPDYVEVTVGSVTYQPPQCSSSDTNAWVLVLNRQSLKSLASTCYGLSSDNDAKALGKYFASLDGQNDLVIVNSIAPDVFGGSPRVLGSLGGAMQELGAYAADYGGLNLHAAAFSLAGMPGLAPGTADSNIGPLDYREAPSGSPTATSIGGTLVQDQNHNYVLVHRQAALFDIAADGTITIGDHSYPVPSNPDLDCDGCGGFHVLVLDRRTLAPLLDRTYATNDGHTVFAQQSDMTTDLASLDRLDVLFFIASVGDPEPGTDDTKAWDWPAYHGWTVRLFDWLVHYGATPGALTDLTDHPRYALVGADSPAAPEPVFVSAEASTEVAQAGDPGADLTATGELQGVLGIGHQQMWYQPVMSNAPVVKVINGEPQPATRTNYGLADILANTTAPWPYTSAGDADQAAYQAAYADISDQLCPSCNGDIRDYYNDAASTIDTYRDAANPTCNDPNLKPHCVAYPSPAPTAYTQAQFNTMREEIYNELGYVYTVDGQQDVMSNILGDTATAATGELQKVDTALRKTLDVDNSAEVFNIILGVAAELISAIPGGELVGLVTFLTQDAMELAGASGSGDDPAADLQVTADNLEVQASDAFLAGKVTLKQDFDRIFSDYGKLSIYADDITNHGWDLQPYQTDIENAMVTAAEIADYQSLLTVHYFIVHGRDMHLDPKHPSQPPALGTWCWPNVGCLDADIHYQYGTSLYAFPNDQTDSANPGWDVIAIDSDSQGGLPVADALPAQVMAAINQLGVDPADVFLRWPLARHYCPVGDNLLGVSCVE